MRQINYVLFNYIIILLFPFLSVGQNFYSSAKDDINHIDIEINDLIASSKTNQENQEVINAFVAKTGKWFKASSDIKNKINKAKNRSGDYSTFSNQNLLQEIQNLEQQQKTINNLNGGITINRITYNSINDLKNGLSEQSLLMVELINEKETINNKLRSLDLRRDRIVADLEKDERTNQKDILWSKLNYLKQKIEYLEEDYNKDAQDLDSPAIWCTKKFKNSSLKCLNRKLYISALTEVYIKKINKSGKEYDPNELANLIKNAQKQSNAVKEEAKYMMNERYDQLIAMVREKKILESKLLEEVNINIDPSGCWVIPVGTNRPQLNIYKKTNGEFVAKINKLGSLHEKYLGKVFFTVSRINATTFEGTEYNYSESGKLIKRIPLRIIVNQNRSGLDYRTSDDILTLLPCW